MLRTEARRGVAPWTGVCTALTLIVTMAAKADSWQGDWGATQDLLHSGATLLGGPLVAAAACWQGARDHRRRTGGLWASTPRARWSRQAAAALPLALWAVAGYAVALAASLSATWPYAGGGGPSPSVAVVDGAFLVAAALLGFTAGVLCRWRLAAPVLAALMYLALGVPTYSESAARYLDPALEYPLEHLLPVWWYAPAMALWTCGLAVAALTAVAARRRLAALVPLAVAAAVAPLIVSTGDGLFRADPAADRLVCTEGSPQICLSGRQEHLLPQVAEALSGLTGRLEGVRGAPKRYVDRLPLHGPDEAWMPAPHPGWYLLRGRLQNTEDFAWQVAANLTMRDCPNNHHESSGGPPVESADGTVATWLAPAGLAPGSEKPPELLRLEAMPDAERRAWLGRYLTARRSCDLSEVPIL
ncbi:hypothetical protein DNK56_25295 [Streptomyces sp. AC1-42W]|nr:hypothetical protein DNK56_25295 [Streptomyces sp. AC1-42W]PZT80587.1 hypothetical protein DNK55_07385 [Streptomyces sp. AC1-42T]